MDEFRTVSQWLRHIPVPTLEEFDDLDRKLAEQELAAEAAVTRFFKSR